MSKETGQAPSSDTPTFASFYDFYDGPEFRKAQLALFVELAQEADYPVLELACGTGIVTLELARSGFHVAGLDISPDMLAVAREKLKQEEPQVRERVRWIEADMRDFDLDQQFGAAFIPSNSFGYLTELDDQKSCLQAVFRHLKPGGTVVIQERNYGPEELTRLLQKRAVPTVQMARVNPLTGRFTTFTWVTNHVDFATQTIVSTRFIDEVQDDGAVKRFVPKDGKPLRRRYFTRLELQLLLEQAGLELKQILGGPGRDAFTSRSHSLIVVARKP